VTAIATPARLRPGRVERPAAAVAGRHRMARRSPLARIGSALATLLFVSALGALLFMTVGPRVFHYRTATMLTGSMAPGIKPGDVVIDTRETAADVKVGQIITYHIPVQDHRVESHRVVWLHRDKAGNILMRTKGDANSAPDPWTAQLSSPTVWRVRAVVPMAGTVIRALRTPIVHTLLVLVLPIALVGWLLIAIWAPGKGAAKGAANSDEASTTE
jgi:signal peptidase I